MEPMLRLDRITKAYGQRAVIQNVSLEVASGESIAVIGPSGCGKTTVLRLIAGLDRPDEGEIWLDGREVARAGRNTTPAYGRRVGLVFQDLALWPHLTVRGNLEFVVASSRTAAHQRAGCIDDHLRMCHVDPQLAERYPHELSGGEQQRVALARALVGAPRVLLLDEPFSNLDVDLRLKLREELVSLQRQLQLTTIYVTHDPADATALADRTVVMRAGRIEHITSTSR